MKPFVLFLAMMIGPIVSPGTDAAPAVYRDQVDPHWSADKSFFWYRVITGDQTHEYVLVDCRKGLRRPAFDHERMALSLSDALGRKLSASNLPVDELDFDSAQGVLLVQSGGRSFRLDLSTGKLNAGIAKLSAVGGPPSIPQVRPSREGGVSTEIAFENRTIGPVSIFWIDDQGKRRSYGQAKPGNRWQSQTYVGHVWEVVDRSGKTLGIYQAVTDATTAVVTENPVVQPTAPRVATTTATAKANDLATTVPTTGLSTSRVRNRTPRGASSPDGQWVAVVKSGNLFLQPVAGGESVPLSSDGKAGDNYATDHLWWSPDSHYLFAIKTEAGQAHKIYTVESSPDDQLQPKLRTLDYLKPGDRIDHPRPRLFDVTTRKPVPVSETLCPNPWSITEVRWDGDSSHVSFVYNQRGHQVLRVLRLTATSGEMTAVVDEQSNTFIDYSGKYFSHPVGDGELIWMSERDGWNHLWLIDMKGSRVKNQITHGDWVVQGVQFVDDTRRQIWFRAGGVRAGQDPYYTHFCRVNFDGTGFVVLTEGNGTHKVRWNAGDAFFIDSWSRADQPPVTELRESESGRLVCTLETADAHEVLKARGGRWGQPFVAKGRDGVTDIYGIVIFPRDFDPAKTYPVVENIYAGPQGFFTPKVFRSRYGVQQQIADRGMIVVQCDGMGTSGRSKAFHDVCCKNLRDAGFPDRIAWIKSAAAKFPQMDLTRVGIYGGSAGGQNAMAALLWHHDFYKVAVADCGCHDNRMDKIWWNEQWMGWPIGPQYAANSNAVNAHLLQGKLMLVFGELDDNVDPSSTLQVVNALEKANKDFELVIVTGAHHGAAETPYGSKKRMDFLTRNLLTAEAR